MEGTTELEPYRIDGPKIIKAYEASGTEMEGNAARVLDYSAVWIHPDGTSRMLEHELIRIQSQEAIGKMAEQKLPNGLLLKMRVIKKDGTILEPELVSGKQTATMPHLEIGDYIETESIINQAGDGQLGQRYIGPHWFFREADIAYWRSEFVVIAPKDKPLVVETRGEVPAPSVKNDGPLVVRRWRVDQSPAAPEEPASAPIQEFLPSVRIGWGISLGRSLGPSRRRRERRATARSAPGAHRQPDHIDRRRGEGGTQAIKGRAGSTTGSSRTSKTDARRTDAGSWSANPATAPRRSSTCAERWASRSRWRCPKTG